MRVVLILSVIGALLSGCGSDKLHVTPTGSYGSTMGYDKARIMINDTIYRILRIYDAPLDTLEEYEVLIASIDSKVDDSYEKGGVTYVACDDGRVRGKTIIIRETDDCFAATAIAHEVAHAVLVQEGVFNACGDYSNEELHPDEWFGPYGKVAYARDQVITEFCETDWYTLNR